MFSKRLIRLLLVATIISRKLGSNPYAFDPRTTKFSIDPEALSKVRRNCNLILFWAAASLGKVIKLYWGNTSQDVDRGNVTLAYWLGGILLTGAFVFTRFAYQDLCVCMNGAFKFYTHLQTTFMPNFNPDKSKMNAFVDTAFFLDHFVTVLMSFFVALLCVYDPTSVIFLGDYIPPRYFYFPVRILVTSYHTYALVVLFVSAATLFGVMFIYFFYLVIFLPRELYVGRRSKAYITSRSLRKPKNLRLIYRSFQILNANVMCPGGYFLVFHHGACMITPIFLNFLLIRYWDELEMITKFPVLIGSPAFMLCWAFVSIVGGSLFNGCQKVLNSWNKRNHWGCGLEAMIMRKFRKSCRLVLISHGTMFVIRKVTLLNYFKGISRGTCRVLLTTKAD